MTATSPLAILMLALALSADAFAAALGRGACARPRAAAAAAEGAVFGGVAALITVMGWMLAHSLGAAVAAWDHWVAFALLGLVGGRMLVGAGGGGVAPAIGTTALMATAVGTSVDAAAVGAALALTGAGVWALAAATGVATACAAVAGMLLGRWAGLRWGPVAEVLGGVALVGLGTMILFEHMGWLPA